MRGRHLFKNVFVIILTNVGSSIALILLNKQIFNSGFHATLALTCLHLFVSAFFVRLAGSYFGVFTPCNVPWRAACSIAAGRVLSIASMNLNLFYNSLSFYQLSKIAVLPATIFVKTCIMNEDLSAQKAVAAIATSVGVTLATVSHPTATFGGAAIAFVAVACCVFAMVSGEGVKRIKGVSTMQMMYAELPLATAMLLLVIPFTGDYSKLREMRALDLEMWILISLSALGAVCINISGFVSVVRLSAIDYLMCGHLKTTLLLAWGVFVDDDVPVQLVVGCAVAGIGLWRFYAATAGEIASTEKPESASIRKGQ